MFKLGQVCRFKRLLNGEIKTLEGQIVGRTFENFRHYDFKVGDRIFVCVPEKDILMRHK